MGAGRAAPPPPSPKAKPEPDVNPGTRVRFNERCVWSERVGARGTVVEPAIFDGKYPADKKDRTQVIVLLDDDPLVAENHSDSRWTCVTDVRSLDVEGPEVTHSLCTRCNQIALADIHMYGHEFEPVERGG